MPRSKTSPPLHIHPGTARDIPAMLSLIRGLAKYERLAPYCRVNAKRFRRDGFGRHRYFETLLCTRAGRPIGVAVYYFAYSTFACEPVLFIEDLFVLLEERGTGAGKAMMSALARIAVRKGCGQMEWIVLGWNAPAIRFYARLGARLDKTWVLTRLAHKHIRRLACPRA
ncbi:MAG: GNAT family N-acetyltransferase [Candidatus Acidoferrales bacterium]|nr:GNAT family N-acetyltransferase [Candidatus Acidoferrales bacterium]